MTRSRKNFAVVSATLRFWWRISRRTRHHRRWGSKGFSKLSNFEQTPKRSRCRLEPKELRDAKEPYRQGPTPPVVCSSDGAVSRSRLRHLFFGCDSSWRWPPSETEGLAVPIVVTWQIPITKDSKCSCPKCFDLRLPWNCLRLRLGSSCNGGRT